jgi:hypothetical protein
MWQQTFSLIRWRLDNIMIVVPLLLLSGFLNYYDACSEGLKLANLVLHKFGGPGDGCDHIDVRLCFFLFVVALFVCFCVCFFLHVISFQGFFFFDWLYVGLFHDHLVFFTLNFILICAYPFFFFCFYRENLQISARAVNMLMPCSRT